MMSRQFRNWVMVIAILLFAGWLSLRWYGGSAKPANGKEADAEANAKEGGEEEEETPERIKVNRDDEGRAVLATSVELQTRMGLGTASLAAGTYQPFVKAWGQLEEDSAHSFTLRSPVAGFLEVREPARWPHIGEQVAAGTSLGELGPRLTPIERADLTTRVLQARAEVDAAQADLVAARASYEAKKRLTEGQSVIALRAVEEAQAKVRTDEARLEAAKQTVQQLEDTLSGRQARVTTAKLAIDRSGVAVEVLAQPGESVESGQALVKLIDLSTLLARVATAAGSPISATPQKARLQIIGLESRVLEGTVLGAVPAVAARGQTFLISVANVDSLLRPGALVEAVLALPGEPAHGVIVPASAVIRLGGSAFVYVQTGEEQFTRVEVKTDAPDPAGWFVSTGLAEKDRVVVAGAGTLLSEELRAQIEAEAGAGGEAEEKDKEKEKD